MEQQKIVITGGPGTGKTSVIDELGRRGFFCIPELVRSMTAAEKGDDASANLATNPIVSVKDPKLFNQRLLEGRISQYKSAEKEHRRTVFFDRGIPDVHAYMHCFGQHYDEIFERPARHYRYDRIVLMPPWREIYRPDGERFESYEESERIFASLNTVYREFGYETTLISKGSVAERTDFILDLIGGS